MPWRQFDISGSRILNILSWDDKDEITGFFCWLFVKIFLYLICWTFTKKMHFVFHLFISYISAKGAEALFSR